MQRACELFMTYLQNKDIYGLKLFGMTKILCLSTIGEIYMESPIYLECPAIIDYSNEGNRSIIKV